MAVLTAGKVKPFTVQCCFAPCTLLLTVSFSQFCTNSPSGMHNSVIKQPKTAPARSSDVHALIAGRCAPWKVASPSERLVLQALHLQRRATPPPPRTASQDRHTRGIAHPLNALWGASLVLVVNRSLDSEGFDGPMPVCT
jgi:hypothetical protein